MTQRKRIAISLGDPAGVGSETTAKAILALRNSNVDFILACEASHFEELSRRFPWAAEFIDFIENKNGDGGMTIEFTGEPTYGAPLSFGKPTPESGEFAYQSLIKAAKICIDHRAEALVTAPLSKLALQKAGHNFRGHTEILREIANVHRVIMGFFCLENRVVPVTRHIAISEVPQALSVDRIFETIEITCNWLVKYEGIIRPRVGVLALNPHAGEAGMMGDEEKIILDSIAKAIENGYMVSGPIVPDTAFLPDVRSAFDVIIGMYHDQVLIPFKMLAFDKGVNATMGLPFIRTSPDHGTAYSIAGEGVANPGSMVAAIELAVKWAQVIEEE